MSCNSLISKLPIYNMMVALLIISSVGTLGFLPLNTSMICCMFAVIKRPPVRKFLNLPDIVPQPTPTTQPNFNFFGGLKSISTIDSPSPIDSSSPPIQQAEEHKSSDRKISSSSVISQRIRNLEKTVKSRRKPKRR